MAIELTEDDYRRLTGRCYELHEKKQHGRDAEAEQDAEADGEETPDDAEPPPDDEEPEAGEEPVDAPPGAPAPGPKPDDDDGNEKPLPPNKDGIWKGAGPWRRPTTVMGASREVPSSWIRRQIRG